MCTQTPCTTCFPVDCPIFLNSKCVTYIGETLPNLNVNNNDTLTTALEKIDALISGGGVVQNNKVAQLLVNENDLPSPYSAQDLADYILTLPEEERTILGTTSKINVIVYETTS